MKKVCLNNYSVVNFGARQRGASLLEGIAYLGIAALVILGAVSLLGAAFSSAQSNRAIEEIVSIRTAVRKLYTGQVNAYGMADITQTLSNSGIFPTTLTPNAGPPFTMTNTWGGATTVSGTPLSNGATFTITYNAVPRDACISMISGATGWTRIADGVDANPITVFPATLGNANTLCAAAANVVAFTSR
jgi:hypothetical protein